MENISLKEIFKIDLSDRFAFPIYKENGKLGGFAFSNKITQFKNEEPFSENNFLCYLNDLEVSTPFPKSTLHWLNWHQSRNQLNNQKNIIVTANFYDLYYLLSLGKLNTIACLQNKIDTSLAKVLSKKVPRIIIAVFSIANQNMFLWKTFLETIVLSDLSFDTVFFSIQNENISSDDLNKVFLNSKPLWEEIVNKFFDNIPSSIKLGEFQKKLLPIFNKIEDQSRKELILDNKKNIRIC
jgi:hypothetical protein